jgi:hypothetical protein
MLGRDEVVEGVEGSSDESSAGLNNTSKKLEEGVPTAVGL